MQRAISMIALGAMIGFGGAALAASHESKGAVDDAARAGKHVGAPTGGEAGAEMRGRAGDHLGKPPSAEHGGESMGHGARGDLLTEEERMRFRERMQAAQTQAEKHAIAEEHRNLVRERAKERGVEPPHMGGMGHMGHMGEMGDMGHMGGMSGEMQKMRGEHHEEMQQMRGEHREEMQQMRELHREEMKQMHNRGMKGGTGKN